MSEDITPATDEQIEAWGEAADAWASKYDGCDEPPPVTEFGYGVVQELVARVREERARRESITKTGQDMVDHFCGRAERAEAALGHAHADTYATLVRERDEAVEDRDRWKARALEAEAALNETANALASADNANDVQRVNAAMDLLARCGYARETDDA